MRKGGYLIVNLDDQDLYYRLEENDSAVLIEHLEIGGVDYNSIYTGQTKEGNKFKLTGVSGGKLIEVLVGLDEITATAKEFSSGGGSGVDIPEINYNDITYDWLTQNKFKVVKIKGLSLQAGDETATFDMINLLTYRGMGPHGSYSFDLYSIGRGEKCAVWTVINDDSTIIYNSIIDKVAENEVNNIDIDGITPNTFTPESRTQIQIGLGSNYHELYLSTNQINALKTYANSFSISGSNVYECMAVCSCINKGTVESNNVIELITDGIITADGKKYRATLEETRPTAGGDATYYITFKEVI